MIKKLGLVGAMALAALAFAIPVTAASANWTENGGPLGSNANIEFSGKAGFNITGTETGAHANLNIKATLIAGTTTASVTEFKDSACFGTGDLAPLTCTGTAQNLPWVAHIEGDNIRITNMELITHYYSPLDPGHTTPVATTTLHGDILATPDNPEAISSVSLSGIGTTANGNPASVTGTLAVNPPEVYGTT